jgi:hypothetical protein
MVDDLKIIWKPQEGSQVLFLSCPIYEVLYEGTRGCQKTDSLIMDFAQDVGKGFGSAWRGIIFRRTYKQLDDIIERTKHWYNQIFPGIKYNESKYVWTWPGGEQLFLRHMDNPMDYWNYHGHQYPYIAWEEITSWPDDKCYESMKACCRSSQMGMPRKYRATTNPWGIGRIWVKRYFVDPAPPGMIITNKEGEQRVRIHGTIYENKALLAADPDYIKRLKSIKDQAKRKAWLLGDWNIPIGGPLDECWDEVRHVIEPFEIPNTWYLDRSFDWGSAKPFSVGWWAESDGSDIKTANGTTRSFPRGTLFRIYEYYGWNGNENEGCGKLAIDIAKDIKKIEASEQFKKIAGNNFTMHIGPADTSIFTKSNGVSIAKDMTKEGVLWKKADKSPGSRIQGLEKFRRLLSNAIKIPIEEPGLFVFSNCRDFIRTVPSLPRDPRNPEDIDSSTEDHIYDETRYRILKKRYKKLKNNKYK